ncbi:hypothetical protein AgCh_018045 [Apium graveolens]
MQGKNWDDSDNDEDEEVGNYALMALEQGESSSSKSHVPTLTTINLNVSQYKETVEKMSTEMFHIHTSMVAANEEVSRLTKINEKLESEKQEAELLLVELKTVRQENPYIKNKLKCASEIEAVLRKKLEKNEVKLKSFKNASELIGQYHEKNKPCGNIAIGLGYDALNNKKKDIEDSRIQNIKLYPYKELQIATSYFNAANKIGERGFGFVYKGKLKDGTLIAIKVLSAESRQGEYISDFGIAKLLPTHLSHITTQVVGTLIDTPFLYYTTKYKEVNNVICAVEAIYPGVCNMRPADQKGGYNENKDAKATQSFKTEEKLLDNQSSKTPVKETKTEDARKKKKNRNGKIGINKSNNFAYVANSFSWLANNLFTQGKVKKVIWIIDSGCSRHMTGDKALLSQFEEKAGPLVTFGDNTLVAGLEVNLLSVSQFADKSFEVLFNKEKCTFISKKTGEVALKGARKGSLFVADLDSTNKDGICCFYAKASEEQSKLWHKKLSHLNFKAINTLVKKELVRDMPKLEFAQVEFCEAC